MPKKNQIVYTRLDKQALTDIAHRYPDIDDLSTNPNAWYDMEDTVKKYPNSPLVCISFRVGTLPPLNHLKNMRNLQINDSVFLEQPAHPFPNWLEDLRLEAVNIRTIVAFPPKLKRLYIYQTDILSLPPFPETLEYLVCERNRYLMSLPPLPETLSHFACPMNKIACLPLLPENLSSLICVGNLLDDFPPIPPNLRYLICARNPLKHMPSDIIQASDEDGRDRWANLANVRKLQSFRSLYYTVKYGRVLRDRLWRIRDTKIQAQLDPRLLVRCLQYVPEDMLAETTDAFCSLENAFMGIAEEFERTLADLEPGLIPGKIRDILRSFFAEEGL